MDWTHLIYFVGVSVMLTLMPGPDILFVITQSIAKSRREGIAVAFGLCTGLIVHTSAAALGISAIFHQSALAFQVLKIAGGIYLFYLAYQAWRERGETQTPELASEIKENWGAMYWRGIWMNLLNPKVSLFFLAFLPQFVTAKDGAIPLQMLLLGALFIIQALLIFVFVSLFAHRVGRVLTRQGQRMKWVNQVKAGIYALLGMGLILEGKD
ncbi:LysE family translocator [Marinithermofilum abyssi]|uniref:LysE family translocator n=1 Tax=Marinithermofilum abyssi TaxID=1571185 RepID=A0A8J2YAG8_9BACL|nr:LysE family translocator [Marinithermofilum abyssi]GGE13586.1 LysE family translocator [Marinithermofilum abyssi]